MDRSHGASFDVAGPDAQLRWGDAREMSALEALMWRIAPAWDRFLAACDWGTRMAPRFRQEVVDHLFSALNPGAEPLSASGPWFPPSEP